MRLGYLKNIERVNDVVSLFARVFYNGDIDKILIPKKTLKPENIITIENDDKLIVGACIIVDRDFFINGNIIKASFLSFICIDEKYRGLGLSRKLMDYTIKECKKRKSLISLVIARKLVDNFYQKFDFFGMSQYSKIKISLDINNCQKKFEFIDFKDKFYTEISTIYNMTYEKTLGAFKRDKNYWYYVNQKVNSLGLKIRAIMKSKSLQGYIIFDKDNVYEVALKDGINYLDVLSQLALLKEIDKDISIDCSLDHPINLWTKNIDYSALIRQCNFGGHMIRINDWNNLKKIFITQIDKKSKFLKEIKTDINLIDYNQRNYENTSLLVSSNILSYSKYAEESLLKSFNIPLMDQI